MNTGAVEVLARRIQDRDTELAVGATDRVTTDGRKTLMTEDFDVQQVVGRDELPPPITPIDHIARLRVDDRHRVVIDARIALTSILGDYAVNVANAAVKLTHHTDRWTVQSEDIETYFSLFE